jgi:hypothetical protein
MDCWEVFRSSQERILRMRKPCQVVEDESEEDDSEESDFEGEISI